MEIHGQSSVGDLEAVDITASLDSDSENISQRERGRGITNVRTSERDGGIKNGRSGGKRWSHGPPKELKSPCQNLSPSPREKKEKLKKEKKERNCLNYHHLISFF